MAGILLLTEFPQSSIPDYCAVLVYCYDRKYSISQTTPRLQTHFLFHPWAKQKFCEEGNWPRDRLEIVLQSTVERMRMLYPREEVYRELKYLHIHCMFIWMGALSIWQFMLTVILGYEWWASRYMSSSCHTIKQS